MREIEGILVGTGLKVGLVLGRFNSFMGERLLEGAVDALVRHGVSRDDLTVVRVPGSFEIPLTCKSMVKTGQYDAVVALGVLIRGGTSHYELICSEVTKGIGAVSLDSGVPVTFGVITTENIEQAIERSGSKAGNKGAEAAMAALEMVNVLREIG